MEHNIKNMTILKDAIMVANIDKVVKILIKEYEDQEQYEYDYRKLFKELQETEPTFEDNENMLLAVDYVAKDEEFNVEGYFCVHGYEQNTETFYSLGFQPWSHWLGCQLDKRFIYMYDIDTYVAHCLWEMTFYGFDSGTINSLYEEVTRRLEEVKSE